MSVINTQIPITSEINQQAISALTERYPFCRSEVLRYTAFGRPIQTLVIGNGPRKVLYTAAHHANEWITAYILLQFAQDLAQAIEDRTEIFGVSGEQLSREATVYMIPMVDPDGVDLVVGALMEGPGYDRAVEIARSFPQIPFPEGWKANLLGVDLNLQYPAGWLRAREVKFMQGFDRPAPRDYVGKAPLSQRESKALAGYTEAVDPELVLAFHSQGGQIYWKYLDIEIPGARELGEVFARVSGYTLEDTPYASGFAGYKDWFILYFGRPGYTVEVGRGENPLPLADFPEIYRDSLGILVTAALGRDI